MLEGQYWAHQKESNSLSAKQLRWNAGTNRVVQTAASANDTDGQVQRRRDQGGFGLIALHFAGVGAATGLISSTIKSLAWHSQHHHYKMVVLVYFACSNRPMTRRMTRTVQRCYLVTIDVSNFSSTLLPRIKHRQLAIQSWQLPLANASVSVHMSSRI